MLLVLTNQQWNDDENGTTQIPRFLNQHISFLWKLFVFGSIVHLEIKLSNELFRHIRDSWLVQHDEETSCTKMIIKLVLNCSIFKVFIVKNEPFD